MLCQGYTSLNRIQSIVYHTAFKTSENMLICGKNLSTFSYAAAEELTAPTGAGKTDVAMLSILRTVDLHRRPGGTDIAATIRHTDFKIIYV